MHQNELKTEEIEFCLLSFTDKKKALYLAIQNKENPILVYGLVIQHQPNNVGLKPLIFEPKFGTLYIEGLDTTGYFTPRSSQSLFTRNITVQILKNSSSKFIEIFARPKKEIIFARSARNKLKGSLNSGKLINYWLKILSKLPNRTLHIFSNFCPTKSIPYNSDTKISDILLFDDDPKNKMIDSIDATIDLRKFYNLLLYRTDCSRGALIYSIFDGDGSSDYMNENDSDVDAKITQLRSLDFSNLENATISTQKFLLSSKYTLSWKKILLSKNNSDNSENKDAIKLIPRKNRPKN
ncbi:hypothetical protein EDEG_00225 [Edhazardia aedis USNM 41457]|uniref:histone acetyltransferase n=1 Tax=Edhazardia aedis (strain USNM 41457) TaxID=1003232 RepID=J9D693_EDHAE|nr:hypothetical protein EDEG_00225 [Edhazardia aedis USNM 41457]|eukprot:EJW03316.1 hypothetical protein EDEG_00225 [Edhazardia aedis USNM 41457]